MIMSSTRLLNRRNKQAFARAKEEAGETGMVCGFHDEDGAPHYFVVEKDLSAEDLRARAFQAMHSRPMNRAEQLLDAAAAGDFIRAYEQAMTHYLDRDDAPAS